MAGIIHSPIDTAPLSQPKADKLSARPTTFDFRPSKSLAQGIKRIGGRSGTSRLGQSGRRGRMPISKRLGV